MTLYVGTGSIIFEECIELSNYALGQGCRGVMVISPYYLNRPKAPLINFDDKLAEKHKNIIGIKDTVSTMEHTREIIMRVKKRTATLDGEEFSCPK